MPSLLPLPYQRDRHAADAPRDDRDERLMDYYVNFR